jgi:hypothetical protein
MYNAWTAAAFVPDVLSFLKQLEGLPPHPLLLLEHPTPRCNSAKMQYN